MVIGEWALVKSLLHDYGTTGLLDHAPGVRSSKLAARRSVVEVRSAAERISNHNERCRVRERYQLPRLTRGGPVGTGFACNTFDCSREIVQLSLGIIQHSRRVARQLNFKAEIKIDPSGSNLR